MNTTVKNWQEVFWWQRSNIWIDFWFDIRKSLTSAVTRVGKSEYLQYNEGICFSFSAPPSNIRRNTERESRSPVAATLRSHFLRKPNWLEPWVQEMLSAVLHHWPSFLKHTGLLMWNRLRNSLRRGSEMTAADVVYADVDFTKSRGRNPGEWCARF